MRLLISTDTVGGVWTFTSELSGELLRRGHAVSLVSFGRRPSASQQAWCDEQGGRYGERFAYTGTEIPLEWMQENDRARPEGEALLVEEIERFRPELVLSNQFCFGALRSTVPRIVVAHSDVLSWAKACRPSALEPSPWLNRYTSLVQSGLLDAAAVVAPTRWMLGALGANFFLPRGACVIPNGVRTATRDVSSPKKLQAVSAGRLWDEGKGLDSIGDQPLPMPLLVAGENEFETEGVERGSNVTWLGPLGTEALERLFRESALYLCLSRYEPFGLAPLEAAATGCAVVARDIPSLREVWGDDALYFSDGGSMRAALHRLAENPALLAEAQRRAHARAEQFSTARMADAYLGLFDSVLQQHRAMPHVA